MKRYIDLNLIRWPRTDELRVSLAETGHVRHWPVIYLCKMNSGGWTGRKIISAAISNLDR